MSTLVRACTANFEWLLLDLVAAVIVVYPLLWLS